MFHVHPYLGKIPILTNIFQMGWNHQLVNELKENKGMPKNVVPYLLYNDNKTRQNESKQVIMKKTDMCQHILSTWGCCAYRLHIPNFLYLLYPQDGPLLAINGVTKPWKMA